MNASSKALARTACFAALFVVATYLGRLTVVPGTQLSLVWPAAGVAVVWFMRDNARTRWLDISTFSLTTVVINSITGADPLLAMWFLVANLVQVFVFLTTFRKLCPELWIAEGHKPFAEVHHLWRLIGAATLAAAAGAAIGPTAVWLSGGPWTALGTTVWMTRNIASIVLIGAVGLRIGYQVNTHRGARGALRQWITRTRAIELAALIVASVATYGVVFIVGNGLPLAFLLLGVTIWAGLRFGTTFVAAHDLALGTAAVLFTLGGWGPFGVIESDTARALTAQAFVGMITVIGLVLALMREERATLLETISSAERRASTQMRLLETIVDTMSEGLLVVRGNGQILVRNRAAHQLLGIRSDTGHVASPNDYGLHYADGTPVNPQDMPYIRALAGETVPSADFMIKNSVVQSRMLNMTATPLPQESGGGAIIVFHDVTADRRQKDELRAFAGAVAHDLRNPLTTIEGWTEVLSDLLCNAESDIHVDAMKSVMHLKKASTRMGVLIDDLLSYATARDATLAPSRIDMRELVAEIVAVRNEPPPGVDVSDPQFFVGDLPAVYADVALVRQLLDNIIGNAIKYTASGEAPQIHISGKQLNSSWIKVEIRDHGIGIARDQQDRVFDDFYRANREGAYAGNGLGLAICKRIVERHGGTIDVESNEGVGSCFSFTLPVASTAVAETSVVSSQP